LSEIRIFIKRELESIKLFDKDFLDIRINETFAADTSKDSYNTCLEEVKNADFFIALYNGSAGWAPDGIEYGICHEELATAIDISPEKTAIIDISSYFDLNAANDDEKKRNELFSNYLKDQNKFRNPPKLLRSNLTNDGFKRELLTSMKNIIYNHLKKCIELSNHYFTLGGNSKSSLDWKKLKYYSREKEMTKILNDSVTKSPVFKDFLCAFFSVPDNMSVEDARAYTGRPFLKDQDLIQKSKADPSTVFGPLHFISIYGKATEIQVKNLIGFPDIGVIKDDYGFYVWEQNTHVQMVFFTECKSPEAIVSKFILFSNWCQSSGEKSNILNRAKARTHILIAMNDAKIIAIEGVKAV
jgi:hypothetical protein